MMDLAELVPNLLRRLAAGDIAGIRESFRAGELEPLRSVLSEEDWAALPGKLEAGDTAWLRNTLGSIDLTSGAKAGLGRIGAAAAGAVGAAGAAGAATLNTPAALLAKLGQGGDLGWLRSMLSEGKLGWLKGMISPADWAELPRRIDAGDSSWLRRIIGGIGAGKVAGAAGALGAAGAAAGGAARGGLGWLKWAVPAVVILGAVGLGVSQCSGGSSDTTTAATSSSSTDAGAASASDTAAADASASDTSASDTAASDTAASDTSASDTAASDTAASDTAGAAGATDAAPSSAASASPTGAATAAAATTAAPAAPTAGTSTGAADFVVYFDTNSAAIRPDAAKVITQAASKIKPSTTVIVTGFADLRGNTQANLALSRRRAAAVEQALKAAGATSKFSVQAKGVAKSSNLQEARRVEIDLP
jgi:outer membrane protein OmpA-like peptidoglycan-associated protein